MGIIRRRARSADSNEVATHATAKSQGGVTAVASAIALLFSGFSLWETTLKRADLSVHVAGMVTYEHDATADEFLRPLSGFEVLAVPIAISNDGARDAAVLSLQLDITNPKTGLTGRFESTYTAEAAYFADNGAKRPKVPFSPTVVAGRSAWTGTVIFYPVSYSNDKALTPARDVLLFLSRIREKYGKKSDGSSNAYELDQALPEEIRANYRPPTDAVSAEKYLPNPQELAELDATVPFLRTKVIHPGDKIDVTLRALSPVPTGWLDRMLGKRVQPIRMTWEMPNIPLSRLQRVLFQNGARDGERIRLRSVARPET